MFKEIIEDFREFRVWIHNWLFYRRHALKLYLAIELANMKQRAFNKRYFVVLVETPKGDKLTSICNTDFKRCKQKKWLPKEMNINDLLCECFYKTPVSLNNKSTKADRREAQKKYLRYAKKYLR